jgi:uncharacterized protein YjbI with pentapeptide repeats
VTIDDTAAATTGLRADCTRCFGLCCVVPAFSASADFAISKPAGQPCPHLQAGFRCGIHTELRPRGFPGCAVYDCFGAGQQVSQVTFAGRDWQQNPELAGQMFQVFPVMRQLHELLWYLTAALALPAARSVHAELRAALEATEALTRSPAEALLTLDTESHHAAVNALLTQASNLARAQAPGRKPDHRGADLVGARLAGADLRGASLRGARLIGADLSRADLTLADLTGADLRGADLRGTLLAGSLFLAQPQLDAAHGDAATELPARLTRPAHWPLPPSSQPPRPARN